MQNGHCAVVRCIMRDEGGGTQKGGEETGIYALCAYSDAVIGDA